MRKIQGILVLVALAGLGLGNIFIRGEELTKGQFSVNIGIVALIVILLLELIRSKNHER